MSDDYLDDYLTDPIHFLYQEKDTGLWGICFRNWDIGFGEMQKDKEDCIKEFRKVYPDGHLYEDYKSANKEYQKVMLKRAAKLRQRP